MAEERTRQTEMRLVADALGGSVEAWHRIVDLHTGLIHGMISRYLSNRDLDERKTVYVEVLETLHRQGLAAYEGRAALGTWIGAITRSRCMDHLRHNFGRQQPPGWLGQLSSTDQRIYHLYYVEGQGLHQICLPELGNRRPYTVEQVVEALDRIDDRMDRRTRRRLAFELEARSASSLPGRVLEYLAYARQQAEQSREETKADLRLLERDTRRLLTRVRDAMAGLDPEEREVIRCRYHRGLTAEEIARRLGISSARRVYTVGDRALRKLRIALEMSEQP